MIDKIIDYNKTFVEQKGYEKYLTDKYPDKIGYPSWVNQYSNTIFMRCPSPELAHKYQLAQNEDPRFGGKLAHVVVMQHFTEEAIDAFVAELS